MNTRPVASVVAWTVAVLLKASGALAQPAAEACPLHVTAVDDEGRAVAAEVHVVSPRHATVTVTGVGSCVAPDPGESSVQLLVSAEGFQPYATDAIAVGANASRELVVTLTRPFSDALSVVGRAANLAGMADSASAGIIGAADLAARPLARAGDLIEAVPGVAMTQHSSGGHAPIVLLRGYNLDHGTDFATSFEGVPLNLPSHGHGQGYTDTNFLIEDLVERIEFQKGPYSAVTGNFGTAGSAHIELMDTVPAPLVRVEAGGHGFRRILGLGSASRGRRHVVLAAEASHDDGPSEVPDQFGRVKAIARYSSSSAAGRHLAVTYAGYRASWTATDGYPRRALERGYVTRFGTLDATDGGRTQQHLLAVTTRTSVGRRLVTAGAFARYYDLDLFSNLTFWTNSLDGDQIWQADRRGSGGGHITVSRSMDVGGMRVDATAGAQARHDAIRVQLTHTQGRAPAPRRRSDGATGAALREDSRIAETSLAPFADVRLRLAPWLRTSAGLRLDAVRMRVRSQVQDNSGTVWSTVASPKLTAAIGPWRGSELYVSGGFGFHSNHAIGVTQRVDPDTGTARRADGTMVVPVSPLVRTRGAEAGARIAVGRRLQSAVAFWVLDSGSELIYVPEEGVTSPERPGRRHGIEWLNTVALHRLVQADLDVALSTARYRTDPLNEGRLIPDAARAVIGGGVSLNAARIGASLRARYVGRRPLEPSGATSVDGAFLLNGSVEWRVTQRLRLEAQGFNLLDRVYEDTAYYYATRLRDPRTGVLEPAPIDDHVTHPGQPRTVRVGMSLIF